MNKELKKEIDLLIIKIKDSTIYKEYISVLNKVNKSDDINRLVDEIKDIEKKLVRTPSIVLEESLKSKQQELNDIPLYQDYKEKLEELNNMLLTVKEKFDDFIIELLI